MRLFEDGKDGSNGNQAINVGTSIQGVERDNILSLPLRFHLNFVLVFFRDEKTGRVGRAKHVDEEVIGEHIKLLHFFTLYVGVSGSAKELGDTSPPHRRRHRLIADCKLDNNWVRS